MSNDQQSTGQQSTADAIGPPAAGRPVVPRRRLLLAALAASPVAALLAGCGGGGGSSEAARSVGSATDAGGSTAATGTTTSITTSTAQALGNTTPTKPSSKPVAATRTWKMGFAGSPSRPTVESLLAGIGQWRPRAELAVMHDDLPWADLLTGVPARTLVARDRQPLADYYRSLGLQTIFMVDPSDGLSRGEDARALRALGRSMVEPAVQQLYRDYALAVASLLKPDVLGLVPESNLIRAAAPAALYTAIAAAATAAAADLRAAGSTAKLLVSVQVETAWGQVAGNGRFEGITRDLTDFPFMQRLGLSSYPFLVFRQPEDIPDDHYRRVVAGSGLRTVVVESGWSSVGSATRSSSPELQARYIARHASLLDSVAALGVAQLLFADPDLSLLPQPLPDNLPQFMTLGLADADFNAKPALARWDALFARPLVS